MSLRVRGAGLRGQLGHYGVGTDGESREEDAERVR